VSCPTKLFDLHKLTLDCRNFGPSLVPLLQVGWRGVVQTDAGFRAHLTTVQNHKDTCSNATWETMLTYAKKLRGNKTKIAFFSSTPQGGGVALMRHALVRFARLLGVDLTWYGEYNSPPLAARSHYNTVQCPSLGLACSVSPRTSTTSSKASATPTSASRPRRSRPLSTGSPKMQAVTGSLRTVPCVPPRTVVPTS
jgi:hypothetical protein